MEYQRDEVRPIAFRDPGRVDAHDLLAAFDPARVAPVTAYHSSVRAFVAASAPVRSAT